jgi:hypothetical protein
MYLVYVRLGVVFLFPLLATIVLYLPILGFSDAYVEGEAGSWTVQLGGPAAAYAAFCLLSAYLLPKAIDRFGRDLPIKKKLVGEWQVNSTSSGMGGKPKTAQGSVSIVLSETDLVMQGQLWYVDSDGNKQKVLGHLYSINILVESTSMRIYYILADENNNRDPFEWAGLAKLNIGRMRNNKTLKGVVELDGNWQVFGPEPKHGTITYRKTFAGE